MSSALQRRLACSGRDTSLLAWSLPLLFGLACSSPNAEETSAETSAVVGAETELVTAGPFTESLGAIGTVAPRIGHLAVLSAPAATRVTSVMVSTGQHVARGDALVELDAVAFAADAASAEASLLAAQQGFDRTQRMVNEGIAARRELEMAAAELARAKADVAAARRTADLSTLRAPIAGVVTRMNASIGASVDASQPLVEIADPSAVDIVLSLPPDDAARLHQGAKVLLHGGTGPDGEALGEATVTDISGMVDSTTHGVAVRARAGKVTRTLRLGETLFAEVVLAVRPHAVTVATQALVPEGDGFKVFVVDSSGMAVAREVKVGRRHDGRAEILKGVEAGERVVTAGAYGVTDSAKIVLPGAKAMPPDSAQDEE